MVDLDTSNSNSSTTANGSGDAAVLFVSSMAQAKYESFQQTLAELKASTTKAVRAEMLDRILDGGANRPPYSAHPGNPI